MNRQAAIVSDMTAFRLKGIYYELTLYMDLWNNEIPSHSLSARRGDRMTYISGLRVLPKANGSGSHYSTNPCTVSAHNKRLLTGMQSYRRQCAAPALQFSALQG